MLRYSYDASGNTVVRETGGAQRTPQLVGQPVNQVTAPGETVSFSVVVADTRGVAFQWLFNGIPILGATSDSLVLTDVSAADDGQYSVAVTNSEGIVTSAPAGLLLDSDDDELPDAWEAANFTDPDRTHPLNPANQRSETDPDQDGPSNIDEYFSGTDPTSPASLRPRLTVHSGAGGSVTVTPMKLDYELGESVTLKTVSFSAGGLVRWSGDLTGSDDPATLRMDGHKTSGRRSPPR